MENNIVSYCCFCLVIPKKEPADLHKLYPMASAKAVRLIGQMLRLEPDARISAEDALNDPYLSKYHDPDDEPICVPVFDFSFEKQVLQLILMLSEAGYFFMFLCMCVCVFLQVSN